MAERTTLIPEKVGGELILHEYVLCESPRRPGSGTARYRRSFSARGAAVRQAAAPPERPGLSDSPGQAQGGATNP